MRALVLGDLIAQRSDGAFQMLALSRILQLNIHFDGIAILDRLSAKLLIKFLETCLNS